MDDERIRPALPADAMDLSRLRVEMYGELGWSLSEGFFERTLAFFQKALTKEHFVTLIQEVNGKIAATGSLTFFEVPPTAHQAMGHSARLMNMYTVPAYRRRGYAAAVLSELLTLAKARECERILLYSLPAGRQLYRKMGFSPLADEWEIRFPGRLV